MAPDHPDLRGAGGGSRRVIIDIFLLTTLIDLVTDLYVVVQALRFVDAFLLEIVILDIAVIILPVGLVRAFLIVRDVNLVRGTDDFALDLLGDAMRPGYT